jgi:hypothetical protein
MIHRTRRDRAQVDARWTLPATMPNYAKRRSATLIGSLSYEAACWIPQISQEGSISAVNAFRLINPQRGIFKPPQNGTPLEYMEHLLSIKTVFPRKGARVWYDDQREAHRQIYEGDDVVDYGVHGHHPELGG